MKQEILDLLTEQEWTLYGYIRNTEPFATEIQKEEMTSISVAMRLANQAYKKRFEETKIDIGGSACIRKVARFIAAIHRGTIALD